MASTISVIIPVYNTVEYLAQCINSVLKQTYKHIEIIIVDDGSTDGSKNVIDRYVEKHSNISAFFQSRKRQGAARNLALTHAKGKYIAFLDSDDLLPPLAYEKMVAVLESDQVDMVAGIQQSFSARRKWVGVSIHRTLFKHSHSCISIEDHPELVRDISVCNRLFLKSAIISNDLFFPETGAGEDLAFMAKAYVKLKSISILPEVVYCYRGRDNSRTSKISSQFFMNRAETTLSLKQVYLDSGYDDAYMVLVASELKKLLGNRFSRVVEQLRYSDKIDIFKYISILCKELAFESLSDRRWFNYREMIRAILLKGSYYDALLAFENNIHGVRYISLIDDKEIRGYLFEPMLRLQKRSSLTNNELLNKVSTKNRLRLDKVYDYLRSLYVRFQKEHTVPLFKFFFLFPIILIINKISAKNVWLMDERISTSAEDNSYFLFKYLRETYPELKIFYVLNNKSRHFSKVSQLGNVVSQYSFKHAFLLLRAKVLLSSDSFRSLAFPYQLFRRLRVKANTHNVFLQHGVVGNKTVTYSKRNFPYFSQVIVSNEDEKQYFIDTYGFSKNEVTVTGIARLDNLTTNTSANAGQRQRKILVAPTWRKWLKGVDTIEGSRYFYIWSQLITSDELNSLLEKNNIKLYFRPHFNMMGFIGEFKTRSSHIEILDNFDNPLHEYIVDSDLLVTDYSSVMYDFFYQEKPVVAYMFDRVEWEEQPPGPPHINYEEDLPADVVDDYKKVLASISYYINNDYTMRDDDRQKIDNFFTYRDQDNCERIYRSVLSYIS